MSTTVIRKQYNPEGTETVLGLPCETITETFDGSVTAGNVVIDDVYSIKELTINDNHSTGVLSMLSKIAEIQKQIRNDEADFPMPTIKGYTIDSNGNADLLSGLQEDVLEEVESVEGMTVDGIKVVRAWKPTTNKSYSSIAASSSLGDVVFKMLTPSQASQFSAMLPSGSTMNTKEASVNIENGGLSSIDDTSKTYNLMAILSKNNCLFCGLIGVNVGIGGGIPKWMMDAHTEYDIPVSNIRQAYANMPSIIGCFDNTQNTPWIVSNNTCTSAIIDLGIVHQLDYTYEFVIKPLNSINNNLILGSMNGMGISIGSGAQQKWWYRGNGTDQVVGSNCSINTVYKVLLTPSAKNLNVNSTDITLSPTAAVTSNTLNVFYVKGWTASWGRNPIALSKLIIRDGSNNVIHFYVPYNDGTEYGMFDLITNTFFGDSTNNKAFTYTLG